MTGLLLSLWLRPGVCSWEWDSDPGAVRVTDAHIVTLQILSGHQARNRIFHKGSGSAFFVRARSPRGSTGSPEASEQTVKCGDASDSGRRNFALELFV